MRQAWHHMATADSHVWCDARHHMAMANSHVWCDKQHVASKNKMSQGHAQGAYHVAMALESGEGVAPDLARALGTWMDHTRACTHKHG